MNRLSSLKWRLQAGAGVALVTAALYAASLAFVAAADTPPEKKTGKKTEKASAANASKTKKLTGAELYAIHCNRCHPERYAMEWNSAQWKPLMLHMRVRANLPAAQAKTILKYLQEDAGN
jgi:cytochrome c5